MAASQILSFVTAVIAYGPENQKDFFTVPCGLFAVNRDLLAKAEFFLLGKPREGQKTTANAFGLIKSSLVSDSQGRRIVACLRLDVGWRTMQSLRINDIRKQDEFHGRRNGHRSGSLD
jgi:hypothetical protein